MSLLPLSLSLLAAGCFQQAGSGAIAVSDADNYSFTVAVDFESVELAAGVDSLIKWDALTTDMRGNPVSGPGEAEIVRLIELSIPQSEVEAAVADGTLTQQDVVAPWEFANSSGVGTAMMSDFTVQGNAFDPASEELGFIQRGSNSWIVSLWRTNTQLGQSEILSSAFIVPSDTASAQEFSFSDSSATLDFTADLHSGSSQTVGADLAAEEYTLDWSGVTVDANGKPFDPLKATQLFIAHLPDAADATSIEGTLLAELNAADTWLLGVYGKTEANLADALAPAGGNFPGFTAGGVWVVGILDPSGGEPAPYFLTVITVE